MYIPTASTILVCVFLAYIGHSIYIMARLFTTLSCTSMPCYKSFLESKPEMQLALYVADSSNPGAGEVNLLYSSKKFDYWHEFQRDMVLDIPLKTRCNGSLHIQVMLSIAGEPLEWKSWRSDGSTVMHSMSLTEYMLPEAETFVLLNTDRDTVMKEKTRKSKNKDFYSKPTTHIISKVCIVLLTDNISLSYDDVPPEMARFIRVNKDQQIMPILKTDFFNSRRKHLNKITKNTTKFNLSFHYKPISIGKLRFMLMVEHAVSTMLEMGFTLKDIDEVKGMFSDTNIFLLCATFFVGSVHLLFDFLAFKNDINFWRRKISYEGLSTRTILWRTFSQVVIFLYLVDEKTSMIVLIPTGLGVLIELWKCKKILKIKINYFSWNSDEMISVALAEQQTEEFDKQGMKYVSYLLYPLCIAGALYSLLYQPHRGWYSWTLNSVVNGVYAFGFLFMLPQLFVNYKLKSVAALPMRAFMYKAFNTFIDDVFAFIITMPTAHRIACLRDDVVFLVYLLQRWLYPVDTKRLDIDTHIEETLEIEEIQQKFNEKKIQ